MRDHRIMVRFSEEEHRAIEEEAKNLGLTVASFVRMSSIQMVDKGFQKQFDRIEHRLNEIALKDKP